MLDPTPLTPAQAGTQSRESENTQIAIVAAVGAAIGLSLTLS